MRQKTVGVAITCLLLASAPLRSGDDLVMKAMRDELARSMQKLRLDSLPKPYFIAYRVQEINNSDVSASFGSLLNSNQNRARFLAVEVRVGDYSLDNTNFAVLPFGSFGVVHASAGTAQLPLEDDYAEIRRQIWLATDSAYKKVLEDFSKKKALLESQKRAEELPDFSREEPATIADEMPPATLSLKEGEDEARQLSALFQQMPGIFTSTVHLAVMNTYTRYVNSEGSSFTRMDPGVMLTALAKTQAAEGMPLEDFVAATGRSHQDLPRREVLAARIREMGTRLEQLRNAPTLEQYSGPMLIEDEAAAELFSQVFAPKLLALRRPLSDNPQLGMFLSQMEDTFVGRIGARVLPEFLTVVDDPTIDEFNRVRLVGGYKADDDGVRARKTLLVENGILKNLLATRDPVPGILHSTGNQGGSGPVPSNLVVTSAKGPKADEMKAELIKLVKQRGKEYGIQVTRVGNPLLMPSANQMMSMFMPSGMREARGITVTAAYKVFPDGHEEPIRNAELAGMTAASFKDILLASSDQTVYSAPFSAPTMFLSLFSGGGTGQPGIHILSFVVPSLLFDDLTLRKSTGEVPNLPVGKHPFFDK
jgi:microcin-processing metallopeptidase PmbA/TldD-like protein